MGSTDVKVLGTNEGIKLGMCYGKMVGTMLWNLDGITFGNNVETELGSLDGYFDFYNDFKLEILLIRDLLGFTDVNVLWCMEAIKLRSSDDEAIGGILWYKYGITLELDVGT